MKLRFHGAIEGVTGSCYELKDESMGVHMLVDCGMVQGELDHEERNRRRFPFEPRSLTHVVLTHAHADHSALIPRLYAEGYRGSVYALDETQRLAQIVQQDAAAHGAPYKKAAVRKVAWHEPSSALFGNYCPIGTDLFLRFFRSGHIVGAASVSVSWGQRGAQRGITFSGDIGPNTEDAEVLPLLGFRMSPPATEYLVVESTYGGTVRPALTTVDRLAALERELDAALFERKGTVVIPCFALERTQDVLCDLTLLFMRNPAKYASIPVVVDSAMAAQAALVMADGFERTYVSKGGRKTPDAWLGRGIFRELGMNWREVGDHALVVDCVREMLDPGHIPKVERRGQVKHWRRIWERATKENGHRDKLVGPAVVLAGQGMCDAGPVHRYLKRLLPLETTTIIFPGYCGGSSVGGKLLAMALLPDEQRQRQGGSLRIDDEALPCAEVRAVITKLDGYSGHADQAGLLDWMWSAKPGEEKRCIARTVIITHGETHARRALEQAIHAKATESGEEVSVEVPTLSHGWFDLDQGRWLDEDLSTEAVLRAKTLDLEREIQRLRARNADLEARDSDDSRE